MLFYTVSTDLGLLVAFVTVFALHSVLYFQSSTWGHFPSACRTAFRIFFTGDEPFQVLHASDLLDFTFTVEG